MEKKLILAIALSLLILVSWSAFTSKFYHIENKEVKTQTTPPPLNTPSAQSTPNKTDVSEKVADKPESLITLSRGNQTIVFIESLASIKEIVFNNYRSSNFTLTSGFLLDGKELSFHKANISQDEAKFIYEDNQKRIIKHFLFHNSSYSIELLIEMQNLTAAPLRLDFPLTLGVLDFHKDQAQARYQDVAAALKDKTLHLNGRKDMTFEEIKFLGLRDRYFCAIIEPQSPGWRGFINKINNQESQIGLNPPEIVLPVGQSIKQNFRIYLGPQELKYINAIKPEWTAIIHYGTFDFIAQLILQVLEALYRLVHNWGWAIIILSIGIYLLLFPLSLKQMHSMKKMQALQPEIEELRRIYKDNPQKLNKEIMELYRRNKANPFAGCLPLILQMPIFFALYQVLMRSVSLKGAVFLWIKDLSEPDRLFQLPFTMPILGNEVNILPILMAIGMFVQQKFSLANTSSGSAEQQKMMMIIMPIMFGFIFYRMPAGLVLYWFVNSLFMLIYQIRISRTK